MPEITRCAGGVVLGDIGTIAMVRNRLDTKWFFPKGHIEEGESDEDAARREIQEEAGLTDLEYIDDLGTYLRPRINKDGTYNESSVKEIHMFLFAAKPKAAVSPSLEIAEACWMSYREVPKQLEDAKDSAWFASVYDRVQEAIQRD